LRSFECAAVFIVASLDFVFAFANPNDIKSQIYNLILMDRMYFVILYSNMFLIQFFNKLFLILF
jgi:hypothetical protein